MTYKLKIFYFAHFGILSKIYCLQSENRQGIPSLQQRLELSFTNNKKCKDYSLYTKQAWYKHGEQAKTHINLKP
jgi:hypothetical protein